MKYGLMMCLLVVGLLSCTGIERNRLETIGKEACRKASSTCQSFRAIRKTNPPIDTETALLPGEDRSTIISFSLLEWNADIFTR